MKFLILLLMHMLAWSLKISFRLPWKPTNTGVKNSVTRLCSSSEHPSLFSQNEMMLTTMRKRIKSDLMAWRKIVAEEAQKPFYLVLQQRQLEAILGLLPVTTKELQAVPHVGPKTVERYADKILGIVNRHISANPQINITRYDPRDLVVDETVDLQAPTMSNSDATSSSSSAKAKPAKRATKTKIDIRNVLSMNVTFEDLSKEQQLAARNVIDHNNNVFISGSAGTGKSFLLRYIIQELRNKYGFAEVAVTAPTGIAAINVGGSTVHSFAGIGIGDVERAAMVMKALKKKEIVTKWRNLKVLIIDEISMLDIELFETLNDMAQKARKNDVPFGGIQLIVVGDFLQLPPVRSGAQFKVLNAPGPSLTEVRTERFCFESYVWEASGLNAMHGSIHLQEVVRQNDVDFINLLNSIRIGQTPPHLMKMLDDCVVSKKREPTDGIIPTKLYCINKDVDEENKNRLAAIDSDEVNILCDDSWTIIPNSNFTRTKIYEIADKVIPSVLTLKRGAQVVLLRNRGNDLAKYNYKITSGIANAKKPLVNGSRGVVLGFQRSTNDRDSMLVRVQFDNGDVVDIGKVEHEISGPDGEGLLIRNQIPLKLAW